MFAVFSDDLADARCYLLQDIDAAGGLRHTLNGACGDFRGTQNVGADITCTANEGYPPLHLKPATFRPGGVVKVRGDVSSQFLTGLLMALPLTGEAATVDVIGELISKPYVEITLNVMKRFGIEVRRTGLRYLDVPVGTYV